MKRTGSMRSRVGPAVTTTLRPCSAPDGRLRAARARPRRSRAARACVPGRSRRRPGRPRRARECRMPRWRSVATFACVAALAHISRFIAGTTVIGASVARHSVVSRSSARPCARRAMKSAEAGAITICAGPARQFDVAHRRFGRRIPEVGAHRTARQRLERQRRDELLRAGRHDDLHVDVALLESAREFGAFIGGDAARDAEQDALVSMDAGADMAADYGGVPRPPQRDCPQFGTEVSGHNAAAPDQRHAGGCYTSGRSGRNRSNAGPARACRIGVRAATARLAIPFVNKELLPEIARRAVRVHVIAQRRAALLDGLAEHGRGSPSTMRSHSTRRIRPAARRGRMPARNSASLA